MGDFFYAENTNIKTVNKFVMHAQDIVPQW